METGKRKFSGRRLYKLATLLVIAISILSGILAYVNYRSIEHYLQRIIKFDEEHPLKTDSELQKKLRLGMWDFYIKSGQEASDRLLIFSAIAVGLPIIFFGGTGLYRYLFPIQRESK